MYKKICLFLSLFTMLFVLAACVKSADTTNTTADTNNQSNQDTKESSDVKESSNTDESSNIEDEKATNILGKKCEVIKLAEEDKTNLELNKPSCTCKLDADVDGTEETIQLIPKEFDDFDETAVEKPLTSCELKIGEASIDIADQLYDVSPTIWALTLDGQNIYILIDAPNVTFNTSTLFYQYKDGKIICQGSAIYHNPNNNSDENTEFCYNTATDIIVNKDGTITSAADNCSIQTDYIQITLKANENGELVIQPQESYDYLTLNDVTLQKELVVHSKADKSSETTTIKPQTIKFTKYACESYASETTNSTLLFESNEIDEPYWIYIDAADNTGGWLYIDNYKLPENDNLDVTSDELFSDLILVN